MLYYIVLYHKYNIIFLYVSEGGDPRTHSEARGARLHRGHVEINTFQIEVYSETLGLSHFFKRVAYFVTALVLPAVYRNLCFDTSLENSTDCLPTTVYNTCGTCSKTQSALVQGYPA